MKEYTFEDYRNIVEKHLMDFIPDVDHKSITLYESMKYSLSAMCLTSFQLSSRLSFSPIRLSLLQSLRRLPGSHPDLF